MLVLSRKKGEGIDCLVTGREPIEIKVVEIRGNQVRLSIKAGRDVRILRAELDELTNPRPELLECGP